MKWIKLHNSGEFDVVTAVNMIGASVKTCDDPIGLYGSGIKYAMAQALRSNIAIKIATGGKIYTLKGVDKEFRGQMFTNIALVEKTGKKHVTGITTDFGKEDWKQDWFIFREFYSNTLDESGTMEIVDGVDVSDDGVDVFLPYNVFSEYADNITDWFTTEDWEIREGTGRIFKRGVFVGKLEQDCKLDVQGKWISITETRTVNFYSAFNHFQSMLRINTSRRIFELFFDSVEMWRNIEIDLEFVEKEVKASFRRAFRKFFGKKAVLCPNVDWMVKDAEVLGFIPVVFPDSWDIKKKTVPTLQDYVSDLEYRETTDSEQMMIDNAVARLAAFIPEGVELDIRVFRSDAGVLGNNRLGTPKIGLNETVFNSKTELLKTLLHEVNHIRTQAEDYTREFENGYADFIVELMM